MTIFAGILAGLGVLSASVSALIYFAPKDNSDAAALAMIPVMLFGFIGGVLLLAALLVHEL